MDTLDTRAWYERAWFTHERAWYERAWLTHERAWYERACLSTHERAVLAWPAGPVAS